MPCRRSSACLAPPSPCRRERLRQRRCCLPSPRRERDRRCGRSPVSRQPLWQVSSGRGEDAAALCSSIESERTSNRAERRLTPSNISSGNLQVELTERTVHRLVRGPPCVWRILPVTLERVAKTYLHLALPGLADDP